jgi:hypothetical protein
MEKGKFQLKKQITMMPCFLTTKNLISFPYNVKEKMQILRRIS